MTAKIRTRWLVVLGAAAAVAALLFHYKQRDTYLCQICCAKKDVFQWRLGSWMGVSVPLTPSWERISDTHFQRDFLPTDHLHDWMFAQGAPYHFFGTTCGGCAIGGGRHVGDLSYMYASCPEFRTFIGAKVQDGSLTKSNVVALMSTPRNKESSPLQKEADALLETFFAQ